jgi:hypothetical protein
MKVGVADILFRVLSRIRENYPCGHRGTEGFWSRGKTEAHLMRGQQTETELATLIEHRRVCV